MRTTYYKDDDILVMHLSDKPIAREVSQDWNTHISYAADGTTVEIVVIDAAAIGTFPIRNAALASCLINSQNESATYLF